MITEPVQKISEKLMERKNSKSNQRRRNMFRGDIAEKQRLTVIASFQNFARDQNTEER